MSNRSKNLEEPARLGPRTGDLTIDQVIEALQIAKRRSPLGGNTVVVLCEWERPYERIMDVGINYEGSDSAVCTMSLHSLIGKNVGLNDDGLPCSCAHLDAIDKMSPEQRLNTCLAWSDGAGAGGWPDKKCIKFLREKMNLPAPDYQS